MEHIDLPNKYEKHRPGLLFSTSTILIKLRFFMILKVNNIRTKVLHFYEKT